MINTSQGNVNWEGGSIGGGRMPQARIKKNKIEIKMVIGLDAYFCNMYALLCYCISKEVVLLRSYCSPWIFVVYFETTLGCSHFYRRLLFLGLLSQEKYHH